MNLHGIVAGAVSSVNPRITAQIWASAGYSTRADGAQIPAYTGPTPILIQSQALQYNDIVQLDGLNIQGERRAVYLPGDWDGVVQVDGKGGDILAFPDRKGGPVRYWVVALVLENWPDWTKVAATLQLDQTAPVVTP